MNAHPPPGSASLFEPRNFGSFLLVSLIWGGTWLVIRDQLSSVPAQWSITYRFVVATAGMFALAALRRESLAMPKGGWGWVALIGVLQFVLNFTFVYNAERFITSGLVAVMFALLMVPNAIFGRMLLLPRLQPLHKPYWNYSPQCDHRHLSRLATRNIP